METSLKANRSKTTPLSVSIYLQCFISGCIHLAAWMYPSDEYMQDTVKMAAFIALGKTLGDHASDIISSFLYRSQTVVGTCATDASDIATLSGLGDIDELAEQPVFCYGGSLEIIAMATSLTAGELFVV